MRRMISYPNPPAGHTHDLVRRDTANERFYEMVVSHIAKFVAELLWRAEKFPRAAPFREAPTP